MDQVGPCNLYKAYIKSSKKDLGATDKNWFQKLLCQRNELNDCVRSSQVEVDENKVVVQKQLQEYENIGDNSVIVSADGSDESGTVSCLSPFMASVLDDSFFPTSLPLPSTGMRSFCRQSFSTPISPGIPFSPFFTPEHPLIVDDAAVCSDPSDLNTTEDIATSLGVNVANLSTSWYSAWDTPVLRNEPNHSSRDATDEKLKKNMSRQTLRQKVLARTLFSPHSPGHVASSTSEPLMAVTPVVHNDPIYLSSLVLDNTAEYNMKAFHCDNSSCTPVLSTGRNCSRNTQFQDGFPAFAQKHPPCVLKRFSGCDDKDVKYMSITDSPLAIPLPIVTIVDDLAESASVLRPDHSSNTYILGDININCSNSDTSVSVATKNFSAIIKCVEQSAKSDANVLSSPDPKVVTSAHVNDIWKYKLLSRSLTDQNLGQKFPNLNTTPLFKRKVETTVSSGLTTPVNLFTTPLTSHSALKSRLSLYRAKRRSSTFLYPVSAINPETPKLSAPGEALLIVDAAGTDTSIILPAPDTVDAKNVVKIPDVQQSNIVSVVNLEKMENPKGEQFTKSCSNENSNANLLVREITVLHNQETNNASDCAENKVLTNHLANSESLSSEFVNPPVTANPSAGSQIEISANESSVQEKKTIADLQVVPHICKPNSVCDGSDESSKLVPECTQIFGSSSSEKVARKLTVSLHRQNSTCPANVVDAFNDTLTDLDFEDNFDICFSVPCSLEEQKVAGIATDQSQKQMIGIEPTATLVNSSRTSNEEQTKISLPLALKSCRFGGFMTGNGKSVSISENALVSVRNTFVDDLAAGSDIVKTAKNDNETILNSSENFEFGFKAAKGAVVKVSDNAIAVVRKIFVDDSRKENMETATVTKSIPFHANELPVTIESNSGFGGFTTAKGNQVQVSKDALSFARKIFDDDSRKENKQTTAVTKSIPFHANELPVTIEANSGFGGFTTAKGTQVQVSKDALSVARKIFDDDSRKENKQTTAVTKSIPFHENELPVTIEANSGFGGFTTAKGSLVAVSEKKIYREGKDFTHDEFTTGLKFESKKLTVPSKSGFGGFTTARGTKVEVSKSALASAKKKLEGNSVTISDLVQHLETHILQDTSFKCEVDGFTTANDTIFKVRESAHANINEFEEDDITKQNLTLSEISEDVNCYTPSIKSDFKCNEFLKIKISPIPASKILRNMSPLPNSSDVIQCPAKNSSSLSKYKSLSQEKMSDMVDVTVSEQPFENCKLSCSPIIGSSNRSSDFMCSLSVSQKRPFSDLSPVLTRSKMSRKVLPQLSANVRRTLAGTDASAGTYESQIGTQKSQQHLTPTNQTYLPCVTKETLSPLPFPSPINNQPRFPDAFPSKAVMTSNPRPLHSQPELVRLDTQEIDAIAAAFILDEAMSSPIIESSAKKRRKANGRVEQNDAFGISAIPDELESERAMARLKESQMIRMKGKKSVRPIDGTLLKFRTLNKGKRIPLKMMGKLMPLNSLISEANGVTAQNATQYKFLVNADSDVMIDVSDSMHLIPGGDNRVGVKEVEAAFLASPGIQPDLVPSGWICNHYRWIVWILAAYQRRLVNMSSQSYLSVENVMSRLKYRYNREIDRSQRSVLRKITERDDTPQKTMVLCVAAIEHLETDTRVNNLVLSKSPSKMDVVRLELTDGWYSVGGLVDGAMKHLVIQGLVTVGTKLVIHGAEICGPQVPCHPLEAPRALCLRLHANSTRRARWWARLGVLVSHPGPLMTLLGSVLGDGGLVGRVGVVLARVYPLVYFERVGARAVFRSEKMHWRLVAELEKKTEMMKMKILNEVSKECENQRENGRKERKRPLTRAEIRSLSTGEDIGKFVDSVGDSTLLQELLNGEQLTAAEKWRRDEAERESNRVSVEVEKRFRNRNKDDYIGIPMLKCHVLDANGTMCAITIWRPSEELCQELKEGNTFYIEHLNTNGNRNGILQLTTTRQTKWQISSDIKVDLDNSLVTRVATPLCLTMGGDLNPPWLEVDMVGVVLRVGKPGQGGCQVVHLVDHHINIVAVNFWNGLKECGADEFCNIGSFICIGNGSWKGQMGGRFGYVHVTEVSFFTDVPKHKHLKEALQHLKDNIKDMESHMLEADRKLDGQFDERAFVGHFCPPTPGLVLPAVDQTPDSSLQIKMSMDGVRKQNFHQTTPKSAPTAHHSKDIRSRISNLGKYASPGVVADLASPPTTATKRAFRIPSRNLQ